MNASIVGKVARIAVVTWGLAVTHTSFAGDRGLLDTTQSLQAHMHMVDLDDVRWTDGLWAERFQVARESMLPNMWDTLSGDRLHAWPNFLIAAGLGQGRDGDHHGPPFNDGDFYKWFEALAQVYAVTRDPELDEQMDRIIEVLQKAQRVDGYLHTEVLIEQQRSESEAKEFRERMDFETYNLGHLMTAACVHHRATGKSTLLEVARKAADYLYGFYRQASPQLARSAICPSHYMGVIEMYRTTGDPRYRQLAAQLIEIRDKVGELGSYQNQDHKPFREQTEAVGHAVRANYLYAGVTDVYLETGDSTLIKPLRAIWENVVTRKMYVTGQTGAQYDTAIPYGSSDHGGIQLAHQAYGHDYQLPNLAAYNESCATIGNALWNWRMLLANGDPRHAEVLETALYNGVLPAVSLDGKAYFYTNPLRKVNDMTEEWRWSRTRESYISSFCCPPNVVRTVAEAANYIYSLSDGTLWVHLYGGNRLDTAFDDGGPLKLSQETEYPWEERVHIKMELAPQRPITVRLRIPNWCDTPTVHVNGKPAEGSPEPGAYFDIKRTWESGDIIQLNLPMPVQLMEANPLVEANLNQVAVRRGPLIYCMENNDLPPGTRLEDVVLPLDADFQTVRQTVADTQVIALQTQAMDLQRKPWTHNTLYREVGRNQPHKINVRLIPYYAWGNRGNSEMTVWLPVR